MPAADESDWVRRAAQGDRHAFAQLVDRYWLPVRRWLHGMTGKEHKAEDITQEAFLKAWIALPTFRQSSSFRTWLFRIARNCWLDACRRSDATLRVSLSPEVMDRPAEPLNEMILSETKEQIQLALATLPDNYRSAYLLWTQEELPYSEIAEILGVSEENARWRVCKARRSLLQKLTPYLQSHES